MSGTRAPIRIGTRGSVLARTQTEWAVSKLRALNPYIEFQTVIIETTGDRQANVPYAAVGTKGMFVKEIEQALIANHIDVGVHSLKDMPGSLPPGLTIPCVPEREDPYDAFVSLRAKSISELPTGSRVGTSSARRRAQIVAFRNDLNIVELRGNLDTRLRKLADGQYDAIIVACAGLNRLGQSSAISARLSKDICLPAVGQGALALETRSDDSATNEILASIHDPDAGDCIAAERALLAALGGGCSVPIAAHAEVDSEQLELCGLVASVDGSVIIRASASGLRSSAEQVGISAAGMLLAQGAEVMLKAHRPEAADDI